MDNINIAVQRLLDGDVVAIPTETVYGLGADCTNDMAVQKIFSLKGRPSFNPLIIHVHDLETALKYGLFNEAALKLARTFWPGPLTIVTPLNVAVKISTHVTAGLPTIAIRCPKHPVALEILRKYPNPIAAPSANRSGYVSPTKHEHVYDEFGEEVFIVPGNQSCIGLESTIVDCSASKIAILRPGFITKSEIENALSCPVIETSSSEIIKAPGQFKHHYSPRLPVRINATNIFSGEALLNFGQNTFYAKTELNLSLSGNLDEAASNLFDHLRQLDKLSTTYPIRGIAVVPIPEEGVGIAINERLQRASFKK